MKERHDYLCKTTVPGCSNFTPNTIYAIAVDVDAGVPATYIWPDGPCAGATFDLADPPDQQQ